MMFIIHPLARIFFQFVGIVSRCQHKHLNALMSQFKDRNKVPMYDIFHFTY